MKTKITIETNNEFEEITVPPQNQFTSMVDDFCYKIIRNQSLKINSVDEMLNYHLIMDAAGNSFKNGKKLFL